MSCGLAVSLAVTPWILAAEGGGIVLRDVTPQTGITFKHTDGSSGAQYLVEAVSAGLVLFDYDGDGWIDIYLLNGAPLKGYRA
ncbi:MAG TPA: CRTAC1 family protein, partial [Planctomycetes bacterium]|nr:CRTAC1 family protein [Planctomycetota bacterium]